MSTKAVKKTRKVHRPMPEDPRKLAQAMFKTADRKIEEGRAAQKPAAQGRQVRSSSLPA